ncbi:phage baseplate assembly protein V [Leptolyngbya sp. FACHB-16]|uniref:phage baseplate assembly protein V n=1 Tax=unclassified Leptolyngbya TaxID=2650499 RepID=UPI0016847522|nr:phage baseplate assembly protein V [Leptolyngbya sp. FACHB-16]MBD2158533.1 baseplate assembly protein [Leptolyngbya sp. FACHB-16]
MRRFYGKYRGKVVNNIDPLYLGRVQVSVPYILGEGRLSWALPCVPYAGKGVGFYAIPKLNSNIWVEFEAGDPDYPIWTGCFWGKGDLPLPPPAAPTTKMFKTDTITLTFDDAPGAGGITIEINPPAVQVPIKLVLNSQGVVVTCNPAALKLTPKGVEIGLTPATVKLSPEVLELALAQAMVKLTQASLDIQHGSATVKLANVNVNVNNGALEVT